MRIQSPKELGRIIRATRIHAGLTQADAAALCGVSAPFLNGVERGKPTARIGSVLAVCHGLGIRILVDPPAKPEELDAVPSRLPRTSSR